MSNIKEKEDAIWEKIKEKEAETKKLRKELFDLRKDNESEFLRNKYLNKCYIRKEENYNTYVYVDSIDEHNRLNCIQFQIINYEKDNYYNINLESKFDFSCHYLQGIDDTPTIEECEEISKEVFDFEYMKALEYFKSLL